MNSAPIPLSMADEPKPPIRLDDPYEWSPLERFADRLCWILVGVLMGWFAYHYFAFPRPLWWS